MKLFGITGGAGMGKSTTGELLRQRGTPMIDTDVIARHLTAPGQPALREIAQAFGPSILSPDQSLNRKELARRVFGDSAARAALEAILHPPIREAWRAEAARWRDEGHDMGAVIIPLLFETQAESEFDAIICVACSGPSQFERLRERGWTPEEIDQRNAAQSPVETKITRSDFVIWTDTTLETHAAQLERILQSR